RMKLLGMGSHPHGAANKDEAASKSPSRLHADDHPKNSLLPPQELDEGSSEYPKDRSDSSSRSRSSGSHGRSAAHSGNGGSFEFHMEERAAVAGLGPFFRQVPSKWNDAEKWIAGRHVVHSNPIFSKKAAAAHGHSGVGGGCVRRAAAVAFAVVVAVVGDRAGEQAASRHEAPHPGERSGGGAVVVGVDEGRRHGDDPDRQPGAVEERHPGRRRHAVPQPALLGAGLAVRVGAGAADQDAPGDRRARAAAGQNEHRLVGEQGGSHTHLAGEERRRRRRSQEGGVRSSSRGMGRVKEVQICIKISEEGGEDSGVGELPEIQIRSQDEACRGAGRSNEGAGEEQPDQEAVHIEPQGGGEAGEGRGEAEPAGGPVGPAGGAHPEDR
uniref:Uncharacterized protein n=1 Tax=Aegilops tauschii subsp. strangulata TaxID=200361 RepID=A0A453JMI6_AEGTS